MYTFSIRCFPKRLGSWPGPLWILISVQGNVKANTLNFCINKIGMFIYLVIKGGWKCVQ